MPDTTGVIVEPLGEDANAASTQRGGVWARVVEGFRDGTLWFAFGTAAAAAFGPEFVKTWVTDESAGRWWFLGLFVFAGLLLWRGIHLRHRASLRTSVGIAVIGDGPDPTGSGAPKIAAASAFAERAFQRSLRVRAELDDDPLPRLDALTRHIHQAITTTPSEANVGVIPILRLHAAFHLGARLGYSHNRDVIVYGQQLGSATNTHYLATMLRATPPPSLRRRWRGPRPETGLHVEELRRIEDADGTGVALALDLQRRGGDFHQQVRDSCRQRGYGWVLPISRPKAELTADYETFTAVIDRIVDAWWATELPEGAGPARGVYLSGPPAIALALGARLAAATDVWTAYTWVGNRYVALTDPTP